MKAATPVTLWRVRIDPSGKNKTDQINTALAIYQDMGMTKQGAAMLIGNFLAESGLDPNNCLGDGGTACGLGQWRFGRQNGMPKGLKPQLKWAVNTEMVRDTGGHMLKQLLFDNDANPSEILEGLRSWERWGVQGDRFEVGVAILKQIKGGSH